MVYLSLTLAASRDEASLTDMIFGFGSKDVGCAPESLHKVNDFAIPNVDAAKSGSSVTVSICCSSQNKDLIKVEDCIIAVATEKNKKHILNYCLIMAL